MKQTQSAVVCLERRTRNGEISVFLFVIGVAVTVAWLTIPWAWLDDVLTFLAVWFSIAKIAEMVEFHENLILLAKSVDSGKLCDGKTIKSFVVAWSCRMNCRYRKNFAI